MEGASFGPEALKVIGRAYDDTWAMIASNFSDPETVQAARLALAHAILEVASDSSRDAHALKKAALQVLARRYRRQSIGGLPCLS
jgi:hypothetical protein